MLLTLRSLLPNLFDDFRSHSVMTVLGVGQSLAEALDARDFERAVAHLARIDLGAMQKMRVFSRRVGQFLSTLEDEVARRESHAGAIDVPQAIRAVEAALDELEQAMERYAEATETQAQ